MSRNPSKPAASELADESLTPRFAPAWASLIYAFCALSLAWPALMGKFLVNSSSDQYIAGYAFRQFATDVLKSTGGFPQWSPYLFGGMPYVAAMHGDIFYPTFLLRLVLPVDVAMTWGMILHFFLSGLATYWFLRHAARLSFFASVVGGVAYMMSGQVSSLLSAGHDGKLFVSALFPLTLLIITRGVRDGRRWAWGLLALIVGLGVLTPHPQLLQYLLLTSGAWALLLAFGGVGTEKLARNVALQRLGLAFGAVVLGAAIGAVQYLPVREYVAWSPRAGGRDYTFATSYSLPLEETINFYLPQFSGILDKYWGRNGIHFHSEYIGAAVIVLATAAFGGWSGARKRLLLFWTGVGIITLLWGLGGSTPFFQIVYAIVPGTKFFRAPMAILYVTTFATAVLAALGTERLLGGKLTSRFAIGWLVGGAVVSLFALAGGFGALALNVAVSPELAERIDANAGDVRLGAIRSFLFLALTCGAIWAVARKRITAHVAGWAVIGIIAADLWTVERMYWGFSEPAKKLYASDATIEFLKKQPEPVRVIPYPTAAGYDPRDPFLFGDALMAHGIRSALGYHSNEIGRYDVLGDKLQGWQQVGNPTFWALTNSHYFLTNADTLPIEGARRVAGPAKNAAGQTLSLFELPGEHPFAWVAPAIVKSPDQSVLEALRAPNFPVRAVALFDTSSRVQAAVITALPAPLSIATTVSRYEPGHIALSLTAPAPKGSALVVSENYYPGWHATVDGKPVNVERADFVLMGIALPEGAKQVELRFTSGSYETGKTITLAALLIAVLLAAVGFTLDRPRGGASEARD
jgi:hypothetical protein